MSIGSSHSDWKKFGVLKTRWRRIFDRLSLVDIKRIPEYVVATCVLYNICILHNDLMNEDAENIDNQLYPAWRQMWKMQILRLLKRNVMQ